jgi:hypothetical protein
MPRSIRDWESISIRRAWNRLHRYRYPTPASHAYWSNQPMKCDASPQLQLHVIGRRRGVVEHCSGRFESAASCHSQRSTQLGSESSRARDSFKEAIGGLPILVRPRWQSGDVPQAEPSTSARGHLAGRILYLYRCHSSFR